MSPVSTPGYDAIAALSCANELELLVAEGSTISDTTIAVRVLSTKALISACSAGGTEGSHSNLNPRRFGRGFLLPKVTLCRSERPRVNQPQIHGF
jgi:hypothetical protein